jgi:hypothetical protein
MINFENKILIKLKRINLFFNIKKKKKKKKKKNLNLSIKLERNFFLY